jgi:hypothetical protein
MVGLVPAVTSHSSFQRKRNTGAPASRPTVRPREHILCVATSFHVYIVSLKLVNIIENSKINYIYFFNHTTFIYKISS